MIENIKKYTPEDYEYRSAGFTEKDLEIMKIGYVGILFKNLFKKINSIIGKNNHV